MARTQTRVSMSRMSGGLPSFTACARVARTEAESASYCWAPAWTCSAASAAQAAKLACHVRARMLQALGDEGGRFLHGHLGRGRLAAVLVFDDAFLQPAVADHEAVRNADQLLVREQHAG